MLGDHCLQGAIDSYWFGASCGGAGETNLKIRSVHGDIAQLTPAGVAFDASVFTNSWVECDPPNNELYAFNGLYHHKTGGAIPLSNQNVLLRGSRLRNTSAVRGLVVYTGQETKLSMVRRTI